MDVQVNATKDQIEEFQKSVLWNDIVNELEGWKRGFNEEMLSVVDDAATTNPSSASVLMHLGDLHGRQKAVDYFLTILDTFLSILETRESSNKK